MTNITELSSLLNWRLLKGGHDFPGSDGGTCINEAAVVAAGFAYRKISQASDCPPCFSRVLSTYALKINDAMPDDLRQELLLPFVTRLAGTKDTREIEHQRAGIIVIGTVSKLLPIALRLARLEAQAIACEAVTTIEQAHKAAADAASAAAAAYAYAAYAYATYATSAAAASAASAADAAYAAASAAASADAASASAREQIWRETAAILDAAMAIGKQAEPIERALIVQRAEAAKQSCSV